MSDQTYYLLKPKNFACELVDGQTGTSYENYPIGAPVVVLTLAHAMSLVMSGDFAWYGPAPTK